MGKSFVTSLDFPQLSWGEEGSSRGSCEVAARGWRMHHPEPPAELRHSFPQKLPSTRLCPSTGGSLYSVTGHWGLKGLASSPQFGPTQRAVPAPSCTQRPGPRALQGEAEAKRQLARESPKLPRWFPPSSSASCSALSVGQPEDLHETHSRSSHSQLKALPGFPLFLG